MKRKNLEKAIIMGLLAASISVPVWAEDRYFGGDFWTGATEINDADLNIDTTGNGWSAIGGIPGYIKINGGDLIVKAGSNGIEFVAGSDNKGTLEVTADNIDIEAKNNGIFANGTFWFRPTINVSSEGNIKITADGQGIDNKRGTVNINGSDNSTISIVSKSTSGDDPYQSGINNESGQVSIKGGNIVVSADHGHGMNNNSTKVDIDATGSVSIVSKDNPIDRKGPIVNAGINNTTGITEITAEQGITVESTHNGIYATGGTVKFDGGTKNKINAVDHGIYATGKNTNVTLEAENNGIYVENNDGGATGVHTEKRI